MRRTLAFLPLCLLISLLTSGKDGNSLVWMPESFESCPQEKKLDIPEDAALKEAERTIKGLFKDDYAKRAPADRLALAKNLLKQGIDTKDNAAARFVLFRESQDLAARGGDIETAFRAVDEMCRVYAANSLALKNAALAVVSGASRTPEEQKALAQAYLALADDACQARQFDLAAKASQGGLTAAKKVKDVPLLTKAESQSKAMGVIQEKYEKVKKSIEALATNPDSPDVNQAVGEFECLVLGDWEAGLPKLAKGSDPILKVIVAKDLSKPSEGADLSALGDGWWDRAEKESGLSRSNLRQRAAYWYEQASSKLSGISKVRVDKRLEEVGGSKGDGSTPPKASSNPIDLLPLVDLKRDAIKGVWTRTAQGIVSPSNEFAYVQLPYVVGEEYDLTLVAQRKEGGSALCIGIVVGSGTNRHHGMVQFDGGPNGDLGPSGEHGRLLGDPRHAYTITCKVRKMGLAVFLDGKNVHDWQGDPSTMTVGSGWVLPVKDAPFIGTWETTFTISKVTLTPISGQAKKQAPSDAKAWPPGGPGSVDVTTLKPKKASVGDGSLGINSNDTGEVFTVNGKECKKYIFAHAPSTLVFDLPTGARIFLATGVKRSARVEGSWKYLVIVDGKTLFESKSLNEYEGSEVEISVALPAGAKEIQLTVDPLGSNNGDHSVWAYPRFQK